MARFLAPLLLAAASVHSQFIHNQLPVGSSFGVPNENATYDYVVVGGGTAGSVVAARLAQDGRFSVAVVEAGGFYELENGNRSVIPGYDFYSSGPTLAGVNPLIDWEFMTTPQAGGKNISIHYTRGRCLGGSSARNYMVYQRPTVGTMQRWADVVGDQSWTWENVLPYYKQSSTLTPPNTKLRMANTTTYYDASVFGKGPLQVGYSNYIAPFATWVNLGWKQAGDTIRTQGMQSGELLGHSILPSSLDAQSQERSSAQTSYINLAMKATQLTIYTHALAKRILFDSTKTATGVVVETRGLPFTISARREVILSAGAFNSPQLLMVSGVGPAATLQKYHIPVVRNAPGVGQNMEDNPFFAVNVAADLPTGSSYQNNPALFAQAIADYNSDRTGYLTSAGADIISFQKLSNRSELGISAHAKQALSWLPDDWPEAMFWSFAVWIGASFGSLPPDARNYGGIVGSITAPLSRGWVTINSSDTADLPIINPNMLTDPTDQEVAVATVRRIRDLLATDAMKAIAPEGEVFPGPNVTSFEDILSAIQGQYFTFAHASVTNKMGLSNDRMAVVDSKARVFGVNSLRVVDISAFPFLPPGQPQATVYMMGEKIADDILHGESGTSGHESQSMSS
ncbi:hypothetical protein BAUCODRAFT_73291 [Baudoinia panamericana UAMH 10762]|uniref:Glucose-methanol-choline oxidoreductase N-terminal domain-containing protein n=1 Tax=Baudoinia panamericana (strain UAMH 10762) TaxID=717646 RepID=M2MD09_BAUPA|nr:uncharacterized protein BAUCODRAFT_73291 [Baudoinia panamericana UAMH 10762]EMC94411.1 hypothetical protein BAUCODRAFT_73291 [Baudoinia panamericana UAMH 10762]